MDGGQTVTRREGREMPPRKAPTVRQRRLGAELRRLRERAGLGLTEAAPMLGTERTTISNTESGRFGVSAERVRAWADALRMLRPGLCERPCRDGEGEISGWWEDYRGELPPAAARPRGTRTPRDGDRAVQIMHMPGLLQNEDYVRAVFAQAVPAPRRLVSRRQLSYRLRRRDVLGRPDPPDCVFMIHEAALRMVYGDRVPAGSARVPALRVREGERGSADHSVRRRWFSQRRQFNPLPVWSGGAAGHRPDGDGHGVGLRGRGDSLAN